MDPKDRLETLVKTATSVTQKRMDVAHVAAGKLADATGMDLTPEQPHPAGIAVHYALGVVPGALYGPLRHRVVGLAAGQGLLYGLGLFLVNDELLNPLLGLASGPTEYPWQAHARGLVAHLGCFAPPARGTGPGRACASSGERAIRLLPAAPHSLARSRSRR